MKRYYGCDAHKKYSIFTYVTEDGDKGPISRVINDRLQFCSYLHTLPSGAPIAIESVGNWYWIIDEIEKAGHFPQLAHAGKAKLMMGQINKTDKLDARGLALLLRNGTLPSIWIPPGELRDHRELPRMRMTLVQVRTILKNRIHATLAKYAIRIEEVNAIFGVEGRIQELPPQTRQCVEVQLKLLDQVEEQVKFNEIQMDQVIEKTPEIKLLMTLPGVGSILAVVIAMEIGDVRRFSGPDKLASYAGTVPRVKSSGNQTFFGRIRPDVNRYLKWAFIEAGNIVAINHKRWPDRHVADLYKRIQQRRGHAKAAVAVARHLAEATYWMLKRNEFYKERKNKPVSSTRKSTRFQHEA